jgi:hypothetical protein
MGGVDWILLAPDGFQWGTVMRALMNLRIHNLFSKWFNICSNCSVSSETKLHLVS